MMKGRSEGGVNSEVSAFTSVHIHPSIHPSSDSTSRPSVHLVFSFAHQSSISEEVHQMKRSSLVIVL